MSAGAVSSACCCGGCSTDCCTFWECSPTSGTFTISAGSTKTRTISPSGQTMTVETVNWSITATLTRTGTGCSTYRLYANTCQFSYQKMSRVYWLGKKFTAYDALGIFIEGIGFVPCDPLPPAYDADCHWNCNSDGTCKEEVEFRLKEQTDSSYMATIAGAAVSPFTRQLHGTLWVPNSVITIACMPDCDSECIRPVLLFAPGTHSATSGLQTVETVDPCACADLVADGLPCLTNWTGYTFMPSEFAVIGASGCLDGSSFDSPRTTSGGVPTEAPFDDPFGLDNPTDNMLGAGSVDSIGLKCTDLDRTFTTKYCESPAGNADNDKICTRIDNCFDNNLISTCYWPDWCEMDQTVIDWDSTLV